MTGTYLDFEGINLLTGFSRVVGKVILRNELGGISNGYEISFAGGKSGYSFGGNQMDLSVNAKARTLLKDVLKNAKNTNGELIFSDGEAFYNTHRLEIEASGNEEALSITNRNLINQALSSLYGKSVLNEAFKDEVLERTQYVEENIINTLEEGNIKNTLQSSEEIKTYLVDYHNQFGLSVNGKMHQFLHGKLVSTSQGTDMQLDEMVTSDDIRLFVSRSLQSLQNPTTFNNRYDTTAKTLLEEGIGKYLSGNEKSQNFIGTKNSDTLIGAGGNDVLNGAEENDIYQPGVGDDLMQDEQGYDTYYFDYDGGHDTIDDKDQKGSIWFNAQPLMGIGQNVLGSGGISSSLEGGRWLLKDTVPPIVLTRTNNQSPNLQGKDLTITENEAGDNPKDSITIKNYPFSTNNAPPTRMGLGGQAQTFPVDTQSGNQLYPVLCKLGDNQIAEVWLNESPLRISGKIYSFSLQEQTISTLDPKSFSIPLLCHNRKFKPTISPVGKDKFVVGYMDCATPLDPNLPVFSVVKAAIVDNQGTLGKRVNANQYELYNIAAPLVLGTENGFILAFQYGWTGDNPTAEIDALDYRHRTPLHHAVTQKEWDAAKFLIASGANPHAEDVQGITPLVLDTEGILAEFASAEPSSFLVLDKKRADIVPLFKERGGHAE